MIALGYLIELDPELRPNFDANVGPNFKDPAYDPGNKYTMAWQSGATGHRLEHQVRGRGDHEPGGPAEPEVRGPRRDVQQRRGLGGAGHARARHHAGDLDARRTGRRPRTTSSGSTTPVDNCVAGWTRRT